MEEYLTTKEIANVFIDPENSFSTGPDQTSDAPQSVPVSEPELSENAAVLLNAQRVLDNALESSSEEDGANLDSAALSEPNDAVSSSEEDGLQLDSGALSELKDVVSSSEEDGLNLGSAALSELKDVVSSSEEDGLNLGSAALSEPNDKVSASEEDGVNLDSDALSEPNDAVSSSEEDGLHLNSGALSEPNDAVSSSEEDGLNPDSAALSELNEAVSSSDEDGLNLDSVALSELKDAVSSSEEDGLNLDSAALSELNGTVSASEEDGLNLDSAALSEPNHKVSASEEDGVNLDSDALSEPTNKTDVDEGTVDTDAKTDDDGSLESGSIKTFSSRAFNDDEEKLPLLVDDKYRLITKIDLSAPIDESRVCLPLQPSVMEQLVNLLQNGSKWDVKVYVGRHKFYCHMCVLQAYSPYFRRSKLEETNVFRLPTHKVTAESFHIIYKWMLYDQPPLRKRFNNRYLMEIYNTAKCLRIVEVMDAVWNFLEIIKSENEAFAMLPDTYYLGRTTFEFLCFSRISRFFLTLVASLEFAEMSLESVYQLLSSHNLGVNSEIEVFYSAVRWLSYKWPQRRPDMIILMRCVRFGLLSPLFLRFLQGEQKTLVMHCISNNAEIQEMINSAYIYVSSELFFKDPTQPLPFPMPEYNVPEQRRWLYDQKCLYHHDLNCTQRQFVSYKQFLEYLQSLHETGPEYWRRLVYLEEPIGCCEQQTTN